MKLIRWLVALAATGTVAVIAAFVLLPDLRWRGSLLLEKAQGKYPEATWTEFVRLLRPGSGFWLVDLNRHATLYAVVSNPFTKGSDAEAGRRIFSENCAACHGADGSGGAAPALLGRISPRTESDWAAFRTVKYGIPGTAMAAMPLDWRSLWQVAGYVRSLVTAGSSAPEAGTMTSSAAPLAALKDVPPQRIEAAVAGTQDWLTYSGNYLGHRYSELDQITPANVHRLTMKWIYQPLSDFRRLETTPLVADGVMFVSLPPSDVAALDAVTGRQLWRHSGTVPSQSPAGSWRVNRGVALLGDRVFVAGIDGRVKALDAKTGAVRWSRLLLDHSKAYSFSAAPLAVRDMVIVGNAGGDFPTRGFLVALDAATGAERWRFETVPAPGQPGNETWAGDSWQNGGAAPWMTGSYDPQLNRIYWGIGNPAPDHVGSVREGDNLYSNSIVALDAQTGRLVWHFQFTPHDLHDWDSTQVPIVVPAADGSGEGKILFANRNGFYYVLDRKTGRFLGATPYVRQTWARSISPEGRPVPADEATPTPAGVIVYPSSEGATNWWPPAYDPVSSRVFVPFMERGGIFYSTEPTEPRSGKLYLLGSSRGLTGEPFHTGVKALDAATGNVVWTYAGAKRTEDPETAGLLATAGGLVFGGDYFRLFALDAATGTRLWESIVGGEVAAAPMTYLAGGRQYVAIPSGRVLLAYGLPDDLPLPAAQAGAREE